MKVVQAALRNGDRPGREPVFETVQDDLEARTTYKS